MSEDMKSKAKREALGKFKKVMGKMGSEGIVDHLKAMKEAPMKVSVMAEDEEGLKEGLEKAEEVLEAKSEMGHGDIDLDSMDADELRKYIKENY